MPFILFVKDLILPGEDSSRRRLVLRPGEGLWIMMLATRLAEGQRGCDETANLFFRVAAPGPVAIA